MHKDNDEVVIGIQTNWDPTQPYTDAATGKPIEPALDDEGTIVACRMEDCVPGAVPYTCMSCHQQVGLSPASIAVLKASPKMGIICIRCMAMNNV